MARRAVVGPVRPGPGGGAARGRRLDRRSSSARTPRRRWRSPSSTRRARRRTASTPRARPRPPSCPGRTPRCRRGRGPCTPGRWGSSSSRWRPRSRRSSPRCRRTCSSSWTRTAARRSPTTPTAYRARMARILAAGRRRQGQHRRPRVPRPGRGPRSRRAGSPRSAPRAMLLTDGGGPVRVLVDGEVTIVEVPRVEVVDTVGAGDTLGGAALAALVHAGATRATLDAPGRAPRDAVRRPRGVDGVHARRRRPADARRARGLGDRLRLRDSRQAPNGHLGCIRGRIRALLDRCTTLWAVATASTSTSATAGWPRSGARPTAAPARPSP